MDEKRALEDFRVRQHAGTHPALAAAAAAAAVDDVGPVATAEQQADSVAPDTGRVIILFDVDSFYCQVEEVSQCVGMCSHAMHAVPAVCYAPRHVPPHLMRCLQLRNPALRGRPLGVTQKYLIVSDMHAARGKGHGGIPGPPLRHVPPGLRMCPCCSRAQ